MKKTFKTLDEQIEILQAKGLQISDVEYAKEILLRENYFFISGYRHLFMQGGQKIFIEGSTFNQLYAVFHFDRHIRNIIFKNILIIENNIKSIIAYQLSKKYGIKERDYLNPDNFNTNPAKKKQVADLIKKMKRQITVNGGQHTATKYYQEKYHYIPLWIVVKILSFGIVGELFLILKSEDQKIIADYFGVEVEELIVNLPILANYRNLCAHEDILYDHRTQKEIFDTRYHKELNVPLLNGQYIYGKNDLFALIIILKEMLRADDFFLMINEISNEISLLEKKLSAVSIEKVLDVMGFPLNYKDLVRL